MNQCKTCRFLGEPYMHVDSETDEWVTTGLHKCNLVDHMGDEYDLLPDQVVGVIDGSGYFAALVVSGDFGCIKWEKSETEKDTQS